MKVQQNDLVELEYSAKADGRVFDTTFSDEAKKAGIFNEKSKYGPVLVAVGKKQVISGLDEALLGVDEGKPVSASFTPEKAFGERRADLVGLIPLQRFRENNLDPQPGQVVELDGRPAKIQSVSGGRVRVDFNSDLAGKTVDYSFKVLKVFRSPEEKVQALSKWLGDAAKAEFKDGVVSVSLSLKKDQAADVVMKKFRFLEGVFAEVEGLASVRFEEEYVK
ncbi:peptidylprolyl isomerase [Candidatus Micrarchaeota archaeon]|nr:peptidylprolyl isomerase [Candidatus Micrarchaeota archaeon]